MSWRQRWVVLVPGESAWVEKRTHEILEETGDRSETHFTVTPGRGRYQAVVEEGHHISSPELVLASYFSLELEEPVYAIERALDFPFISRFLKGQEEELEHHEPEELVSSLGCVMPWDNEPPPKPLERVTRTVVLVQGLSAAKVHKALEKYDGYTRPVGCYRLEEGPQGLLIRDGTGELTFQGITLSERFPLAMVYSVIATPSLDHFQVSVMHGQETKKFFWPPEESCLFPIIDEVMGERTPERILAAMGIPKEWFQL